MLDLQDIFLLPIYRPTLNVTINPHSYSSLYVPIHIFSRYGVCTPKLSITEVPLCYSTVVATLATSPGRSGKLILSALGIRGMPCTFNTGLLSRMPCHWVITPVPLSQVGSTKVSVDKPLLSATLFPRRGHMQVFFQVMKSIWGMFRLGVSLGYHTITSKPSQYDIWINAMLRL